MHVQRGAVSNVNKGIDWKRHKVWIDKAAGKYKNVTNGYETVEAKDLLTENERECIKLLGVAREGVFSTSEKTHNMLHFSRSPSEYACHSWLHS